MTTETRDTKQTAGKPAAHVTAGAGSAAGGQLPEGARRVLGLRVPVIVRLAHRSMPLGEITRLSPGSLIEFEKSGDSDLDLMITSRVIGRGHAVKVGENFGLRIKSIGPVRERIRSLGADPSRE